MMIFSDSVHPVCSLFSLLWPVQTPPSVFSLSGSSRARMKIKTAGNLTTAINARGGGGKKRMK